MATDRDFTTVIKLLGPRELKDVFYAHDLGLRYQDIEKAQANGEGVEGKARNVLQLWRSCNGRLATRRVLVNAMKTCRLYNQLHDLQNDWHLTGKCRIMKPYINYAFIKM